MGSFGVPGLPWDPSPEDTCRCLLQMAKSPEEELKGVSLVAGNREEHEVPEASSSHVCSSLQQDECSEGATRKRVRYVLPGGTTVHLRSLYQRTYTVDIYVKWGNFRSIGSLPKERYIAVNLQKQLEEKRVTYKPVGTHISLLRVSSEASEYDVQAATRRLADTAGNWEYTLALRSWGRHSVLVSCRLLEELTSAVTESSFGKLSTLENMHVELLPRVRSGESYAEATEEDIARLRNCR